jgi:glutamyl/glutaminyl-tRNA synthetase
LIRRGRAYPDFCTTEDLDKIRKFQEDNKVLPGYYGVYARDRNLSVDEEIAKIKAGTPWVIRYRSMAITIRRPLSSTQSVARSSFRITMSMSSF